MYIAIKAIRDEVAMGNWSKTRAKKEEYNEKSAALKKLYEKMISEWNRVFKWNE